MIQRLNLNDMEVVHHILELQLASYKVEADLIGFYEIPPLMDNLDTLKDCDEIFYGYYIDENLVGIISYKIEDRILDIHRVAVHPSFFKRGIANKLLFFVEGHNIDIVKIIVSTGRENVPAVSLYMKNGYKKVEDIKIGRDIYLTFFQKDLVKVSNI